MRDLRNWSALAAGLLFAIGLGMSGMTSPDNILAFLDVAGAWNPSLAFVMVGALGVHALFVRIAKRRGSPVLEQRFDWPTASTLDVRLLIGASLFGLGWGLSGYCPGPAIVALVTLSPSVLIFVAAMLASMLVARLALAR